MKALCDELGIKLNHAAVYHPQANGQVEAINKLIKYNIKKKIEGIPGKWVEELPPSSGATTLRYDIQLEKPFF